jgi:hypothetical protein
MLDRGKRINVNLGGELTTEDGVVVKVRVLDLSSSGFRLMADDELLSGERVTLRVGREESLPAVIRWVIGREAGGNFSQDSRSFP